MARVRGLITRGRRPQRAKPKTDPAEPAPRFQSSTTASLGASCKTLADAISQLAPRSSYYGPSSELPLPIHSDPTDPLGLAPYLLNQKRFNEQTLGAFDQFYEPVLYVSGAILLAPRRSND
jgi:hypothetical protein